MAKSMMSLWSQFLLTVLLIVAANRADAQADVHVTFNGTASGSSTGTFWGVFSYDQSQTPQANHTIPVYR